MSDESLDKLFEQADTARQLPRNTEKVSVVYGGFAFNLSQADIGHLQQGGVLEVDNGEYVFLLRKGDD